MMMMTIMQNESGPRDRTSLNLSGSKPLQVFFLKLGLPKNNRISNSKLCDPIEPRNFKLYTKCSCCHWGLLTLSKSPKLNLGPCTLVVALLRAIPVFDHGLTSPSLSPFQLRPGWHLQITLFCLSNPKNQIEEFSWPQKSFRRDQVRSWVIKKLSFAFLAGAEKQIFCFC